MTIRLASVIGPRSYYSSLAEAVADLKDDGIFNQSVGDFSDNTAMEGGSITLVGVTAEMLTFDSVYLI